MKQLLHNLKTGEIETLNVPCPRAASGHLLIRSRTTLISSGTERMLVDFGKAGWIQKARSQPDKVHMVLEKARTDGLAATIESVRAKLEQPVALGYSNAGVVIETGAGTSFQAGDRVVSNGSHADVVHVPKNLCARIPEQVSDDCAAFTVIAAIGLEGIRLARPTLGEYVVVTGLGLVGLITVQLLRANGCRVLGIDFDAYRLHLAEQFGATTVNLSLGEDPVSAAERFSHGMGVDAVLLAAATASNEPVRQAALMCRKRGRIVLVGVSGLQLSRDDFYKKELSLQVSCSYGPGRYDSSFEEGGHDYPYAYVRWTAQRNFEAILAMLADNRLTFDSLITHRFPLDQAEEAYRLIQSKESHLGVLLQYPSKREETRVSLFARTIELPTLQHHRSEAPEVAFLGAGGYATKVLIPAFKSTGVKLRILVSNGGVSASTVGRKYGFEKASTEPDSVFSASDIDTVVIATRHDSHARYVCKAILAGKNVFVEKPLALSFDELDRVKEDYATAVRAGHTPQVMMGFNRRFAPHVIKMKCLLRGITDPKAVVITVNAGHIPPEHWTQDVQVGGGRILGEGCHFVDLCRFLIGSPVASVQGVRLQSEDGHAKDTMSFSISFADGSIGTVHYFASGHKSFPKERVEVFCGGRVLRLDNFRRLRGWGWSDFKEMSLWRQDKGAKSMTAAFVGSLRKGKPSPISFDEIIEVSRTAIQIANL